MTDEQKIDRLRGTRLFFACGDLFVYAALILIIVAFTVFSGVGSAKKGTYFEIIYGGECIFSAPLDQDAEYTFYIDAHKTGKVVSGNVSDEEFEYNVICVQAGKVIVIEANCADHVCYGTNICLPHKMTVRVHVEGWETDL